MKRKLFFTIALIAVILFSISKVKTYKIKFLGFLDKNEKVILTYNLGLSKEIIGDKIIDLQSDGGFYKEIKFISLFEDYKFGLQLFNQSGMIFDSTYVLNKKNPIYLIGISEPNLHKEMVKKQKNLSLNDRIYFLTPQDDRDLEDYILREHDKEVKVKKDSTEQILLKKQTKK